MGCGVESIPELATRIMDYKNAHLQSEHIKNLIYTYALSEFNPSKLLNRIIFIDDNNILLPPATGNGFYERPMVIAHGLLEGTQQALLSGSSGTVNVNKFMFCTTQWLEAFCICPLYRYIQSQVLELQQQQEQQPELQAGEPLPPTTSTLSPCVAIATRIDVYEYPSSCGCSALSSCACQCQEQSRQKDCKKVDMMICDGCYRMGINQDVNQAHYQCMTCHPKTLNLCEECYLNNELHDQTHSFLRYMGNNDISPTYMDPRVRVMIQDDMENMDEDQQTASSIMPTGEQRQQEYSPSGNSRTDDIPIATAIPIVDVRLPIDDPPLPPMTDDIDDNANENDATMTMGGEDAAQSTRRSSSSSISTRCFHQGQIVRITGLDTARHLNGCVAIVERMMCDGRSGHQSSLDLNRRIIVRLLLAGNNHKDCKFSFHPDNLKLVG